MPVLRFKAEDVRRVVEHSIAAPKQSEQVVEYVPHTTKPIAAPAVLLVHRQGVYLVSNGKPRDIVGADATDRKDAAKDEGWPLVLRLRHRLPSGEGRRLVGDRARSGRRRRLRRDAAMGAQAEGADRRRREDHHAAHD